MRMLKKKHISCPILDSNENFKNLRRSWGLNRDLFLSDLFYSRVVFLESNSTNDAAEFWMYIKRISVHWLRLHGLVFSATGQNNLQIRVGWLFSMNVLFWTLSARVQIEHVEKRTGTHELRFNLLSLCLCLCFLFGIRNQWVISTAGV